ncbi:protein O-mannose kinase-like [Sycon ciliatum]|uniref:protein O-mannose kinase-like n=1 Tax=Sycon ciliatum TaxID=27933 RepID=UPI0031F70442
MPQWTRLPRSLPLASAGAALCLLLCLWICTVYLFTIDEAVQQADGPEIGAHSAELSTAIQDDQRTVMQVRRCSSGYILRLDASSAGECVPCPNGTFSFPGWVTCKARLTCDDLARGAVRILRYLASGAVKHVFLGRIIDGSLPVAYALRSQHHEDFGHHIAVLRELAPSPRVVQLLGECRDEYVVTQYWKLGNAGELEERLALREYAAFNTLSVRFGLAMDYVACLVMLHEHDYVMCDGNDVTKLLSQFLITDDWRLVVNDLDAAARINVERDGARAGIKCGKRQLFGGEMIAPEQLWPFGPAPFNNSRMPAYDEKIDIWRIPPAIHALLGPASLRNTSDVLSQLAGVFARCRSRQAAARPSAVTVWKEMAAVQRKLNLTRLHDMRC